MMLTRLFWGIILDEEMSHLNCKGQGGCKVEERPERTESKLDHQPGDHMELFYSVHQIHHLRPIPIRNVGIKGLTINTRETQKAVMAVKTNHSPTGCSFRWGGAAIAHTKHTLNIVLLKLISQPMVVFENGKQTIESEIPASFSKPGMERTYIGSQRRFVCSRDVINILPNNTTFFVSNTNKKKHTSPGRGSQSSESLSHIPCLRLQGLLSQQVLSQVVLVHGQGI